MPACLKNKNKHHESKQKSLNFKDNTLSNSECKPPAVVIFMDTEENGLIPATTLMAAGEKRTV